MPASPKFWWRSRGIKAVALAPFSWMYGGVATRRMKRKGLAVHVPVICVGNFVAGGGGKTPTALALAELMRTLGKQPGFLTRGYGGRNKGPLRVDPKIHNASDVGDEPLLLAANATTVIARDRRAGANMLVSDGVDIIIMDDGFQNPSVRKDLSLVAIDAAVGVGNAMTIPAGPLRAPLSVQMKAADAIVRVGTGSAGEAVVRAAARMGLPVINATLAPVKKRGYKSRKYLAFAGIARPEKFYQTLADAGVKVVATRNFPDHHRLTASQCRQLLNDAERDGLTLITTEKDAVRLRGGTAVTAELADAVQIFPVLLRFEQEGRLLTLIEPLFHDRKDQD